MPDTSRRSNSFIMSKFNTLTPENALCVKGGKDVVKVCMTVEIKHCVTVEGKYCGAAAAYGPIEIQGPVDPWGGK